MNRLNKITYAIMALCATILIGCSGPKAISDKDLVKIFHDAFLANAYFTECVINDDSLLLYEPILARHGYTVEDMQYTVETISQRKSSRLSDLVGEASRMLEEESKEYNYQLMVLDTIDNIAKRKYTRIVYSDSLISAKRLKDTAKLHIVIRDLTPGEYTITFDYNIDTADKNRNSRVEAYMTLRDSSMAARHTMMLSRYREAKYQRKFNADSIHKELHVNMFYHPKNEESKSPSVVIRNFTVTRILPTEQAVDSLFEEQMGPMLFNHKLMNSFKRDVEPKRTKSKSKATNSAKPQAERNVKTTKEAKTKR